MGRSRVAMQAGSSENRPRGRVEVVAAVCGCGGDSRLLTLVGLGDEKCEAIGEHLASLFCLKTDNLVDGVRRQSTIAPPPKTSR